MSINTLIFLEEAKFYKTVASNITYFDNGPRVIRQPPPLVSLGEDLGLNVSWTCDAVANGSVTYSWLKNNQVTLGVVLTGNCHKSILYMLNQGMNFPKTL